MLFVSSCFLLSAAVCVLGQNGDADAYFLPTLHVDSKDVAETGEPLFLTPMLRAGNASQARELSRVRPLPNAHIQLESFAGFLTVDDENDSNLFYWLFSSMTNASEAPLVIWLQGGPGWSSLYSTFEECGPYAIYNKVNITLRNYTWVSVFNVLFIDNPVGTGFSFTRDPKGYDTNMDQVSDQLYQAVLQIFQIYPEFQGRDFYISGESYAGKYVTGLSHRIYEKQPDNINLKGMAIGNGVIDPAVMVNWAQDLYPLGLIDEKQQQHFYKKQNEAIFYMQEGHPGKASDILDELMVGAVHPVTYFNQVTGLQTTSNYLFTIDPSGIITFGDYLSIPGVRRAIHAGNATFHGGTRVAESLGRNIAVSVRDWFIDLFQSNQFKIMLFSGQLDTLIGYRATTRFVRSLSRDFERKYYEANRTVWKPDPGNPWVAGYVKQVGDFYEVLVRNGGHSLVNEQPNAALDMMKRFIFDIPFGP